MDNSYSNKKELALISVISESRQTVRDTKILNKKFVTRINLKTRTNKSLDEQDEYTKQHQES